MKKLLVAFLLFVICMTTIIFGDTQISYAVNKLNDNEYENKLPEEEPRVYIDLKGNKNYEITNNSSDTIVFYNSSVICTDYYDLVVSNADNEQVGWGNSRLGKFTLKSGETARITASVNLQFYYMTMYKDQVTVKECLLSAMHYLNFQKDKCYLVKNTSSGDAEIYLNGYNGEFNAVKYDEYGNTKVIYNNILSTIKLHKGEYIILERVGEKDSIVGYYLERDGDVLNTTEIDTHAFCNFKVNKNESIEITNANERAVKLINKYIEDRGYECVVKDKAKTIYNSLVNLNKDETIKISAPSNYDLEFIVPYDMADKLVAKGNYQIITANKHFMKEEDYKYTPKYDDLSIGCTFDKDSYSSNEDINISFILSNITRNKLKGIHISNISIGDTYSIKNNNDIDIDFEETANMNISLEKITQSTISPGGNADNTQNGSSSDASSSNDSNNMFGLFVLFIVSIVFICYLKNNKKVSSLFVILMLILGAVDIINPVEASASCEVSTIKTVVITKNIAIDGVNREIKITIEYLKKPSQKTAEIKKTPKEFTKITEDELSKTIGEINYCDEFQNIEVDVYEQFINGVIDEKTYNNYKEKIIDRKLHIQAKEDMDMMPKNSDRTISDIILSNIRTQYSLDESLEYLNKFLNNGSIIKQGYDDYMKDMDKVKLAIKDNDDRVRKTYDNQEKSGYEKRLKDDEETYENKVGLETIWVYSDDNKTRTKTMYDGSIIKEEYIKFGEDGSGWGYYDDEAAMELFNELNNLRHINGKKLWEFDTNTIDEARYCALTSGILNNIGYSHYYLITGGTPRPSINAESILIYEPFVLDTVDRLDSTGCFVVDANPETFYGQYYTACFGTYYSGLSNKDMTDIINSNE